MNIILLWLIVRCLTSVVAGAASIIRPLTPIELMVPLLPPSQPISQWLERAFISPWLRWDAVWYQQIVQHGYSLSDGTISFHPLYPWLATPLAKLGVQPLLSLLLITTLAGAALLYLFSRLASVDLNKNDTNFAVMLLALSPLSFILFAPYPEALFLLFSVLCIYELRRKAWWMAGLAGGLAVLTRQQGILLLFPFVWELWEDAGRKFPDFIKHGRKWLAMLPIPAALILWLIYRVVFLGDRLVDLGSFQKAIFSVLISPTTTQLVPTQQFLWPWQTIYNSISKLILQPDVDIVVNVICGLLFLVLLGAAWKKMRISYRIYALAIAIISYSFYTGPVHPMMSLPRHLFLAFPTLIGIAQVIQNKWARLIAISLSVLGMSFLLILFVLQAWIP